MQSVLILGRQPELGLAEVESLYGAAAVRPVGEQAAVLDVDPCLLAFDRLGGAVKFCKLLTILAQTVKVQDIAAYAQRDQARPKRYAKVGMLPPKLAQIIINLAVGRLPDNQLASICDIPAGEQIPRPHLELTLLDPFCGTGV